MTCEIPVPPEPELDIEAELDAPDNNSQEGFRYVVGYVQKKLLQKFPGIHIPKATEEKNRWIETLNKGQLTIPNADLINICQELNTEFEQFHGDKIYMGEAPMETLLSLVLEKSERSEIFDYIAEIFLKVRFFNRIKWMNANIKADESAEKIRRCKQVMQHLY